MTSSSKQFAKAMARLAVCAAVGLGGNAFAVQTWEDLGANCTGSSSGLKTYSCANGALTIQGYSTAGSATYTQANVSYLTGGGFGVQTGTESGAAAGVDNNNGVDALRLNFTSGVDLANFKLGWDGTDNAVTVNGVKYNDSDVSVYAWTGTGAPAGTINLGGSLGAGWTLVGNYANVGQQSGTTDTQVISTNIVSSSWLISTSRNTNDSGDSCIPAFDSFRLVGITTTPKATVPEPGSLALMAVGLLGMAAFRRRQLMAKETTMVEPSMAVA